MIVSTAGPVVLLTEREDTALALSVTTIEDGRFLEVNREFEALLREDTRLPR